VQEDLAPGAHTQHNRLSNDNGGRKYRQRSNVTSKRLETQLVEEILNTGSLLLVLATLRLVSLLEDLLDLLLGLASGSDLHGSGIRHLLQVKIDRVSIYGK
jgi:hypothetical protein